MSFTLIAIIIAIVAACGGMVKAYFDGESNGEAKITAKYTAAQKTADDAAAALKQEQENHISDMQTAFDVGKSESKTIFIKAQAKGATDAQTYAVFANPVCTIPDDSLANYNTARAAAFGISLPNTTSAGAGGVPSTAHPGGANATVPAPSPSNSAGRQNSNSVPTGNSRHGSSGQLLQGSPATNSSGQIPGSNVPSVHPKPIPTN